MYPVTFFGGPSGRWAVERATAVRGDGLANATYVDIVAAMAPGRSESAWTLRGVAGHARYVEAREKAALAAISPPLGRAEATCAAPIPIRKSAGWWALAQDERRAIFEDRSRHIADSMKYLPRVARRLYHARDLGEPFDFLTWFEFAPADAPAFDELVLMLRARDEWRYVDREVDLRLRAEVRPPSDA